jgi:hypothetical protein
MGFRQLSIVFLSILILSLAALTVLRPASGSPRGQGSLQSLVEGDIKTVLIHFERKACYGSCPAYTLTIHGDGRIEYVGATHVKTSGSRVGRIEAKDFKALLAEFDQAKFGSIADDYSAEKCACRRCTDMASVVTELNVGAASHKVNHYYGCACAPRALFDLESAIDKAADSEQWTGDVSKEGPYGTTCFGS